MRHQGGSWNGLTAVGSVGLLQVLEKDGYVCCNEELLTTLPTTTTKDLIEFVHVLVTGFWLFVKCFGPNDI